jgi:hypothetical protein
MAEMTDNEMLERNLELQATLMQYLFDHPAILDHLPDDFRLVILPDEDPELGQRNLELLSQQDNGGKPVVIVRVRARQPLDLKANPPQVFVPVMVTG